MQFAFFGTSDIGRHRKHNEDSYLCNPKEKLFLIADGIGGQAAGEIASNLAIRNIEEFIVRSSTEDITWPIPYKNEFTLEQNSLLAGATLANRKVRELANQNPSMKGMGTTLVGVIIKGNQLAILNIGDSRLYRIRAGEIEQITQDHTIAGEQEKLGLLTKEEASNHPQKHILTSALGIEVAEKLRMDLSLVDIQKRDLYIMCSDGLNDMLNDKEILAAINSSKTSLEKMSLSLTQQANLAGGQDNITIILLSFY
ncbi:MAG: serine/threonine-protein phosphatase [Proteobacteria bacterium]|nr:serine/threonine-protein phosphatase [Pseudomonadota bacterium]